MSATTTSTSTPTPTVTLTFSPKDLPQLEAFAALHGTTLASFIQRAALEAADITPSTASKKSARSSESELAASWLNEPLSNAPEVEAPTPTRELFAPVDEPESAEPTPTPTKKGVAGEPSKLARGTGPVWEIRRALGNERVHGLGWTREHMAFVLGLSVIGVRKMEHMGTTPVKSMEARKKLLELAKLLKEPTPEITAYIEAEERALG